MSRVSNGRKGKWEWRILLALLKYVDKCTRTHALRMQPVYTLATSAHTPDQNMSRRINTQTDQHKQRKQRKQRTPLSSLVPPLCPRRTLATCRSMRCSTRGLSARYGHRYGWRKTSREYVLYVSSLKKQIKNKGEYSSMGQRSKTKNNTTHEHVKHQNTDTGIHVLSTSPICPCC